MKILYKFIFILILLASCTTNDAFGIEEGTEITFLKAAVNENCETFQNFTGDDIYGYPLTDATVGGYWQIGGHPNNATNEMPDLGINIVASELETQVYDVADHYSSGKALIYYIDENGNEFNSTANNSNSVHVIRSPGNFVRIEITFNNVEVYSAALNETKCINNFSYSFVY